MERERVALTWEQVDRLATVVASKLARLRDPCVACIPRGGLVVGGLVAYKAPNISKQSFYSLDGWPATNLMVLIDDIVDTGVQMREAVELMERGLPWRANIITCSLVTRYNTPNKPTIYGMEYPGDEWLVFPWAPND